MSDLCRDVGERYSIATLVFFIPCKSPRPALLAATDRPPALGTDIIFEFPSNLLLRRVGARNLLSSITILWGIATLAIGFVKNWQSLVGLRVVLGFFEAGFFPGCVYLLSSWYTRWRTQVSRRILTPFARRTMADPTRSPRHGRPGSPSST